MMNEDDFFEEINKQYELCDLEHLFSAFNTAKSADVNTYNVLNKGYRSNTKKLGVVGIQIHRVGKYYNIFLRKQIFGIFANIYYFNLSHLSNISCFGHRAGRSSRVHRNQTSL